MPHIVLKGKIDLEMIFNAIEPIFIRNGEILKTLNTYINYNKTSILIESLVLEKRKKITFLGMISKRIDGIVVRIYPGIEIEKTEGVKRLLAKIAIQLLRKFPELTVSETNLSEFLK